MIISSGGKQIYRNEDDKFKYKPRHFPFKAPDFVFEKT